MPNIKFSYLYRDGANYKNYSSVIIDNSTGIEVSTLTDLVQSKLVYGEWFYASEWKLPDLRSNTFDFEIDPTWHEFESVEFTDEAPTSFLSAEKFKELIEKTHWLY